MSLGLHPIPAGWQDVQKCGGRTGETGGRVPGSLLWRSRKLVLEGPDELWTDYVMALAQRVPVRLSRSSRSRPLTVSEFPDDTTRIARREDPFGNVAGDHATRADDSAGSDAHARQDERSGADPDVGTDEDGLAILLFSAQRGVERMHRRQDLNGRSEEREVADTHLAHVEHDAVEVEEHSLAELDVGAVVAVEGRLHPDRLSALAEQLRAKGSAELLIGFPRGVQRLA
jgi:hypothetical protein